MADKKNKNKVYNEYYGTTMDRMPKGWKKDAMEMKGVFDYDTAVYVGIEKKGESL